MHIFETVKASVPPGRAAKHYGLTVSRNGMTRYPFHDDRHPSMKLNKGKIMMKDDKITLLQERLQRITEEANEPT